MGGLASGASALIGGIAGSQRDSGQDVGSNMFSPGNGYYSKYLGQDALLSGASLGKRLGQENTIENSTNQVQNNPILSQLFGPGGTMARTGQQEQDLSSRGYSLQPEDHEAYGQASGNIARMFGSSEQGLAQEMANRGMSNSGAAQQGFSNMFGNKQEQLAKLQTDIAQKRMDMNNQRLQQTRQFLGQMGAQAQGAIGQANDMQNRQAGQTYGQATDYMKNIQGVNQQAFEDRQNTQQPSQFSRFLTGAMGGAGAGANMFGALSGGGKAGAMGGSAGQSSLLAGALV